MEERFDSIETIRKGIRQNTQIYPFQLILVLSCIGTAFGLIVLGSYMTLKSLDIEVETFNWIPVASFSWSIFISSFGIQPLTLMILVEIMPEKIKDASVSFCMTLLWLFGKDFSLSIFFIGDLLIKHLIIQNLAFINIKFLPSFIEILGFHWTMYMFSLVCIFGVLFTISVIPETKGKSHEEIMKSLQ